MRRIRIFEHMPLDGVIQSPGGPDEDRDGGFEHGGWSAPFADPAVGEVVTASLTTAFDLLLGRRTYDIWSGYWPGAGSQPLAANINAAKKFVATTRPDSLDWGPVESLGPDVVAGVRRVRAEDGPDLIIWGSSTLVPVLLEHGLVDEVVMFVYPVLLGTGKRIFAGGAVPRSLELTSSTPTGSGVVISIYEGAGALRTGTYKTRGGRTGPNR